MKTTKHLIVCGLFLTCCLSCAAQILQVSKIKDPSARLLQQQYISQLQKIANDATAIHFPYPFYFTQMLDVDESRQKQLPQGSIHFDRYNDETVLEITGNYYIAYPASILTANQRARETLQDVVLPLLRIEVARIDRSVVFDAYAFEISHHVRTKVMGINTEGPENVMFLFPRAVAERLVHAQDKDTESQQTALLESDIYVNGKSLALWLGGDTAPDEVRDHYLARYGQNSTSTTPTRTTVAVATLSQPVEATVNPRLIGEPDSSVRTRESHSQEVHDMSAARMERLQLANQGKLDQMLHDLDGQAKFVAYAPPAFVPFRDGAYLQLSMNTELAQPAGSSQYRVAALAFDQHVTHLLRPASKYFQGNPEFEGIDFSTTVHQPGQTAVQSVEFVIPLAVLACYEKYDCTGQEVISRSIVLINGERVALDLQNAESDVSTGAHQ